MHKHFLKINFKFDEVRLEDRPTLRQLRDSRMDSMRLHLEGVSDRQ